MRHTASRNPLPCGASSGVMDTAVFFPIVNGGGLVLTAALAMIVFRERLTRRQWIGMLLGILSVILVCDPF